MKNDETKNLGELYEQPQATPKRHGSFGRVLKLLVVLAAVLGIVLLASYWDLNSFDSVRRLFTYSKTEQTGESKTNYYSYTADRGNLYEMLGERLIVVSPTRIAVLSNDGTEVWSQSVKFTNPALVRGGKTAAAYDVGGDGLYILGEKGLVRDMSGEAGGKLISVSLNTSDYMAVVSEKSGYKASAAVYNTAGEPAFTFNSSGRYITCAAVEKDCRHLSVVTVGEANGTFESAICRYELTGEQQISSCSVDNALLYDIGSIGGTVVAAAEDRFVSLSEDGSLGGAYYYVYPHLRGYSFGGTDFAAVALSRYRSGSAGKLVTLGADGNQLASVDLRKEVLDVSANGKYLAVLFDDSLTVYTSDLQEYATLDDSGYAKNVLMRTDGTALLIGASEAKLFIP